MESNVKVVLGLETFLFANTEFSVLILMVAIVTLPLEFAMGLVWYLPHLKFHLEIAPFVLLASDVAADTMDMIPSEVLGIYMELVFRISSVVFPTILAFAMAGDMVVLTH